MNHRELLPDYVLGLLSEKENQEVESYLVSSSAARAELAQLQKTLVRLSESVPEQTPQISFAAIQQRLKQPLLTLEPSSPRYSGWAKQLREWRNYALAASLALAIIGFSWALQLQKQLGQTQAETRKINYWLAHNNVKVSLLSPAYDAAEVENYGSLILLEDGRCLFIMKYDPPAGKSYQVWGQKYNLRTSLAISQTRLIEVKYTDYEVLGVSLEPYGGSPEPTETLSRVSTR
jgi:anti-sigma-K factor RskA